MPITHGFHATMTAAPGRADEVIDLLLHAPALPDEDCVVFVVGRSASNARISRLARQARHDRLARILA